MKKLIRKAAKGLGFSASDIACKPVASLHFPLRLRFWFWSFLAEPKSWSDGLVNRLRPVEIRACFEQAGFQILDFQIRKGEIPPGFRNHITKHFQHMSDDDICATGINIIVRRPLD